MKYAIQTKTESKEALERQLALGVTNSQSVDPVRSVKVKQFANMLAPDEAFVDIIRYKDAVSDKPEYFGFAVSRRAGKGFRLGDADEIDRLSKRWLHAMATNSGTTRDVSVDDHYQPQRHQALIPMLYSKTSASDSGRQSKPKFRLTFARFGYVPTRSLRLCPGQS